MRYHAWFVYALCRAILFSGTHAVLATENEKTYPDIYFKNGSYIKTIKPGKNRTVYRGNRVLVVDWTDLNNPNTEDVDATLGTVKGKE